MVDGYAKRIVERAKVMHIECDEMCHSGRLQQLGHIARVHRVTRFGASFLARISKIRDESYPRTHTCIAQSCEQKQQTHQTIRYRGRHRRRERLHDAYIPIPDRDQGTQGELPAGEAPLLDVRPLPIRRLRDCAPEGLAFRRGY